MQSVWIYNLTGLLQILLLSVSFCAELIT